MASERTILHCDMNCFYASCEMAYNPKLQGKPIAVCGDPERRNGIVLTASYPAKWMGVKTGMPLWEAQQHCRDIIFVPAHYDLYTRYSGYTREIFLRFTDQVEPFGLDEAWLDCTASRSLFGTGEKIAKKISDTVKDELGITCSVGVSWNKVFAKLGSDYKKPDAITVISRSNWKDIVFPLPATDLLYVGSRTGKKLSNYCIHTIGDLATANPNFLKEKLGKIGPMLWGFANGLDTGTVAKYEGREAQAPIKSIGNSWTTPRDLLTDEDVWIVLYLLSESVAARLRENHFRCRGVEVSLRDSSLFGFERQVKLPQPTMQEKDIAEAASSCTRRTTDGVSIFAQLACVPLTCGLIPSQIRYLLSIVPKSKRRLNDSNPQSTGYGIGSDTTPCSEPSCTKTGFSRIAMQRGTTPYIHTDICRGVSNSCQNKKLRNMSRSSPISLLKAY